MASSSSNIGSTVPAISPAIPSSAPPMPISVSVYAELLPNIRQISLAVVLAPPAPKEDHAHAENSDGRFVPLSVDARVLVKPDGRSVRVVCSFSSEMKLERELELGLPGAVVEGLRGKSFPPPAGLLSGSTTLPFRLPLSDSDACDGGGGGEGSTTAEWSATELSLLGGGGVACRGCEGVLVGGGRIREWKDLPSENWAEMMEFWHCHKPEEKTGCIHRSPVPDVRRAKRMLNRQGKADEETLAARGYGANNSIVMARIGTAFVDLTTVRLNEEDCEGMMVRFLSLLPYECSSSACTSDIKKVAKPDSLRVIHGTIIDTSVPDRDHASCFLLHHQEDQRYKPLPQGCMVCFCLSSWWRGWDQSHDTPPSQLHTWLPRVQGKLGMDFSPSTFSHGKPKRLDRDLTSTPCNLNLYCASCSCQIGYFNDRSAAVTLFKWQIRLAAKSSKSAPGLQECLSTTLAATMARSGSSKSLLMPMGDGSSHEKDTNQVVHVWVLHMGIRYSAASTSSSSSSTSIPAVKLLFRKINRREADEILESLKAGDDAQEISLPRAAIEELLRALDRSNKLLPPGERLFSHKGAVWRVGLLRR